MDGGGIKSVQRLRSAVEQLREYLEAEGRDAGSFPIAKRAYVAIDRPQEEVAGWFRAVYGGAIPPEVAIAGSPDRVLAELQQLQDAGAELVLISPVGDDRPELELVIEHLLPALR